MHIDIPHIHPGNHNSATVGSLHDLRRVEVKATVEILEIAVLKKTSRVIEFADKHARHFVVIKFFAVEYVHGRENQHVLPVKLCEVRTFPHAAEIAFTARGNGFEFPRLS